MRLVSKLRYTIVVVALYMVWMNSSPANLYTADIINKIEIDGVNYGTFKMEWIDTPANIKVVLSRNFITEPSLYLWAQKSRQLRKLQDLHIITEGGNISDVKSLKCYPLKWEIEKEDSGFSELVILSIH